MKSHISQYFPGVQGKGEGGTLASASMVRDHLRVV
jgi:hypothetical protein